MNQNPTSQPIDLKILDGRCHVLVAFDCGQAIDLDQCERRITEAKQRATMRHRRRAPSHFQYRPLPLRVTVPCDAISVTPEFATEPQVEMTLWDFGAALVAFAIPVNGAPLQLLDLANTLYDNPTILDQARWRLQQLLDTLQDAVVQPNLTSFHEDYLIFEIKRWTLDSGEPPAGEGEATTNAPATQIGSWCERNSQLVARILRSEPTELSAAQAREALRCSLSYGQQDVAFLDWNAALVFDEEADDLLAVLEYANVELLELRWLDQKLDDALDGAYSSLVRRRKRAGWSLSGRDADLDRVARLQVDSAILFEGVNNALKLIGDQYLARAYQLAAERFHLADWDSAILRKLDVLDNIYGKLSDRRATQRMEILEWIIIILILVSIILPYLPGYKH